MSPLLKYREQADLTQEELAEKAGVSVRTIQRIEAGSKPKGFTLKALSSALGIAKETLLEEETEGEKNNRQLLKYINLSSLLMMIFPPANIIIPLLIMYWKKEFSVMAKEIVSIQILWTIFGVILVVGSAIVNKSLFVNIQLVLFSLSFLLLLNLYIIIQNTIALDRKGELSIQLKFSVL